MVKKSVLILVPLLRRLFVTLYDTFHEFHLVIITVCHKKGKHLISHKLFLSQNPIITHIYSRENEYLMLLSNTLEIELANE